MAWRYREWTNVPTHRVRFMAGTNCNGFDSWLKHILSRWLLDSMTSPFQPAAATYYLRVRVCVKLYAVHTATYQKARILTNELGWLLIR